MTTHYSNKRPLTWNESVGIQPSRLPIRHTPSVTLSDTLQGLKIVNLIPHNALEERLAAVHAGSLEAEAFVLRLLDQQRFMPVRSVQTSMLA